MESLSKIEFNFNQKIGQFFQLDSSRLNATPPDIHPCKKDSKKELIAENKCDITITRGGTSVEACWCFNLTEQVPRINQRALVFVSCWNLCFNTGPIPSLTSVVTSTLSCTFFPALHIRNNFQGIFVWSFPVSSGTRGDWWLTWNRWSKISLSKYFPSFSFFSAGKILIFLGRSLVVVVLCYLSVYFGTIKN